MKPAGATNAQTRMAANCSIPKEKSPTDGVRYRSVLSDETKRQ
jgi:hypothetical protein